MPPIEDFTAEPTHYMILSNSGKPVYHSTGSEQAVTGYMGVLQAIVSCFDEASELRSFEAEGGTLFVFLARNPLILVAIDKLGRSEHQLRHQLELLHAQILSTLTQTQLERAFAARANLDLQPMLAGTEKFLDALVRDFICARPWSWLGALESMAMEKPIRDQLHMSLLEARTPALLYGLLVSCGQFAGVVRPRKHSLHPPDLHLVFSMLFNTQAFVEGEHWVPICLPRFNSSGFLYAYINFLAPGTALVLISPDKNAFFEMQGIHQRVLESLHSSDTVLPVIADAVCQGRLRPADVRAPLITHFVYKSSIHVQFVRSDFSTDGDTEIALQMALLQAHMVRHKLRLCYTRCGPSGEHLLLGWHTPAFETYCWSATSSIDDLSHNVKRLVSWLRRHESRLFIVDGATF